QAPIPQFGGYHHGGFHAALADGSVRFLADSLDQNTLRNAINARDGNAVNLSALNPGTAGRKTAGLDKAPSKTEILAVRAELFRAGQNGLILGPDELKDLGDIHGGLMFDINREYVNSDGSIAPELLPALTTTVPIVVRCGNNQFTGLSDKGFAQLAKLDNIVGINNSGPVTKSRLLLFSEHTGLRFIDLRSTTLSESDLAALDSVPNLQIRRLR
ncbi:MAG: DUF1559 domain-containing protein, partial [Planctomycetaceae bacterium]